MTSISDTNVVNAPGGLVELAYVEITSNVGVTGTSAASPTEVIAPLTFVSDGSPLIVEFFTPRAYTDYAASGRQLSFSLYQDGSEIIRYWGFMQNPAAAALTQPIHLIRKITPSAGVHTFGVKAFVNVGTGVVEASNSSTGMAPTFLRVSKIIQASQLIVQTPNAPLVTSLPSNAIDGQEVRYLVDNTNGIVWNFRYRAGSSSVHKWEFIGGSPLRSTGAGSSTNSTTPQTTNTPSIAVPLAGDYDCSYGGFTQNTAYGVVYNSTIYLYKDTTSLESLTFVPVGTYNGASIAGAYRATNLTASQVLNLRYAVSTTSSTSSFGTMFINTTPIRVSA